MLYKRPNGWAVVLQVRGVAGEEAHRYRVWVEEGEAWSDAGRLVAAEEDAAALVDHHRGEALPKAFGFSKANFDQERPGGRRGRSPWGRLLGGAGAGEGDELRLAPGSESGSGTKRRPLWREGGLPHFSWSRFRANRQGETTYQTFPTPWPVVSPGAWSRTQR